MKGSNWVWGSRDLIKSFKLGQNTMELNELAPFLESKYY